MSESNFSFDELYATDADGPVKKFYREYFEFYGNNKNNYGGEAIFSLNTILGKICALLDKKTTLKHALINVDGLFEEVDSENESIVKLNLSVKTEDMTKDDIQFIENNYAKTLGNISSQRVGRVITIMHSPSIDSDFKLMLLKYICTIRKLGNYMPLPKLRMNGKWGGNSNTINQRKGNYKKYLDDPFEFYKCLNDFLRIKKNKKFKGKFYTFYGIELTNDEENFNEFLGINRLLGIKKYFDKKYHLKGNCETLGGIYMYMSIACKVINERHKLLRKE